MILTTQELVDYIYEENFSHIDFMDNMGGDCDCNIHTALNTIMDYWTKGE
jgi:uncharacterized Fe-S center protein